LKVWSGLGYNRRGKFLREAAIAIADMHNGKVPRDSAALRALPGIGPYTASAILIFAFNMPDTMIETNVRSAFIHGFFNAQQGIRKNPIGPALVKISDRELLPLIAQAAEDQDPRTWHWALMDYGSHLKKTFPNPSRASAHHVKQSKFEGSLRQVRGAILRELYKNPVTEASLRRRFNLPQSGLPQVTPVELKKALAGLARDGMIKKEKGKWRIV
jgi:A/G-specific adenine glycosylase